MKIHEFSKLPAEGLLANIVRGLFQAEFIEALANRPDTINRTKTTHDRDLVSLMLLRGAALRHHSRVAPEYRSPFYIDLDKGKISDMLHMVGREPDIIRFSKFIQPDLPQDFKLSGTLKFNEYLEPVFQRIFGGSLSNIGNLASIKIEQAITATLGGMGISTQRFWDWHEPTTVARTYTKKEIEERLDKSPFYRSAVEVDEVKELYARTNEFPTQTRITLMRCPGLMPPPGMEPFVKKRREILADGGNHTDHKMPLMLHQPERLLSSVIALLVYHGQKEEEKGSISGSIAGWLYDLHNISYSTEQTKMNIDMNTVRALTMIHLVSMSGTGLGDVTVDNPLKYKVPHFLDQEKDKGWLVDAVRKKAGLLLPYDVDEKYVSYGINRRIMPLMESVFPGFGKDPANLFNLNSHALAFVDKFATSYRYYMGGGCGNTVHHANLEFDCDAFNQGFPGASERAPLLPYRAAAMALRSFYIAKELRDGHGSPG